MTLTLSNAVLWALALVVYLAPSCIAEERGSRKLHPIIIVNIFLGWTVIGWVIAVKWACEPKQPPAPAQIG
jgi:uncharacterized sodium:solute symporter family permease YidK